MLRSPTYSGEHDSHGKPRSGPTTVAWRADLLLRRNKSCNNVRETSVSSTVRGEPMFSSIKCRLKGHLYVDSRSQPGTRVCVRCKDRQPFEGLVQPSRSDDKSGSSEGRHD